jgi:hypothetical protein
MINKSIFNNFHSLPSHLWGGYNSKNKALTLTLIFRTLVVFSPQHQSNQNLRHKKSLADVLGLLLLSLDSNQGPSD